MGIHQPKNIYEADSARKRLIFDEFFYLQVKELFCICFHEQKMIIPVLA